MLAYRSWHGVFVTIKKNILECIYIFHVNQCSVKNSIYILHLCFFIGLSRKKSKIIPSRHLLFRFGVNSSTAALGHGEILREIIFYCGNNRLHEFQKYDQIHVDAEHFAALFNRLNDFFHDVGVPETQANCANKWNSIMIVAFCSGAKLDTHLHGCTDAIFGPGRCGCVSIVTVFLAWSWLTSSYICSTLSGCRFSS